MRKRDPSIQTGEEGTSLLKPGEASYPRRSFGRTLVLACLSFVVLSGLLVLAVFLIPREKKTDFVGYDWSPVDQLINEAIAQQVTPGATLIVGALPGHVGADSLGILYSKGYGSYTYGLPTPIGNDDPAMSVTSSLFDLASLTKVLASTTALAQFYQRGELDLDTLLVDPSLFGPEFGVNGKAGITVRNLLLHNAGFFPDPVPEYWSTQFGCPETAYFHPALNFSCVSLAYAAYLNMSLMYAPGTQFVYSDLSFIGVMWVVGRLALAKAYVAPDQFYPGCQVSPLADPATAQCAYEAYVRLYVLGAPQVAMNASGFLPQPSSWALAPPTWNDTYYRHEIMQGVVSDENAYALGGISGHAGLFATTTDVASLARALLFPPADSPFFNATTQQTFFTVGNVSQSNRALGWAINLEQYWYDGNATYCQAFSQATAMHTGYTGTMVCLDPINRIYAVFLTNRCYPVKLNFEILALRQSLSYAIVHVLGLQPSLAA